MSPAEYVEAIVVPTMAEALANRSDRRRCYLACIAVFHVFDYLAGGSRQITRDLIGQARAHIPNDIATIEKVANGVKHAGGDKGLHLIPGTEREFRPFGFGEGFAGFGEGRWGHPGLGIDHAGQVVFLEECALAVLLHLCREHPTELGTVDLAAIR